MVSGRMWQLGAGWVRETNSATGGRLKVQHERSISRAGGHDIMVHQR